MGKAHHPLGASNCDRWTNCLSSPWMIAAAPPDTGSIYAAQGTLAHNIAADVLDGKSYPEIGTEYEIDGHEVTFDDEMFEGVSIYVEYCQTRATEYGIGARYIFTENQIVIPDIEYTSEVPGVDGEDLFGTTDRVMVAPFRVLHVIDFKFGVKPVSPVENSQLLYYGLGALLKLHPWLQDQFPEVRLTIVQPRAFGDTVKSWTTTVDRLREFHQFLKDRAAALAPEAGLKAGDWCTFCPAKATCPEKLKVAQETTLADFRQYEIELRKPEAVPPALLVNVLDKADSIKSWLDSVWAWAFQQAESNPEIRALLAEHGYGLVEGRKGNKKWTDASAVEAAVAVALQGRSYPIGQFYTEPKLISPAQMEKALKKAGVTLDLTEFITQAPGKPKLAKVSDDRPELPPKAVRDFQGITIDV